MAGRRRGQGLTEFALVLPMMMILLGAVIQVGLILWANNSLTQAVAATARWAATQRPAASADCTTLLASVTSELKLIVQQSAVIGYSPSTGFPSGTTVSIKWSGDPTGVAAEPVPCPPQSSAASGYVVVSVTNYQVPVFFPSICLSNTCLTVPNNGKIGATQAVPIELAAPQ